MKKLKFLPSVLMLVLAIAIVGIGVYSATPGTNTIVGTITVNAANAEIQVMAYLGDSSTGTPLLEDWLTIRSGETIDLDSEGVPIGFDVSSANEIDDVDDVVITFAVKNKSTQPLGIYFSEDGTISNSLAQTQDGASKIATTGHLNGTNTRTEAAVANAVNVTYTGYSQLAGTVDTTIDMVMTISLPEFQSDVVTIDLEDNDVFLYVEPYDSTFYVPTPTEGLAYSLINNGTEVKITGIGTAGAVTDLVIPSTIEGKPVVEIQVNAFQNNQNITSVYIPSSVTCIGTCAFYMCENLTSAILPQETWYGPYGDSATYSTPSAAAQALRNNDTDHMYSYNPDPHSGE